MTVFSYMLSFISGTNLKEPYILARLYGRLLPWQTPGKKLLTGWVIHYTVGLLFTELYVAFRKNFSDVNEKKAGLVFGGLAGLAAILIWKFTLSIHPLSPAI